MSVPALDAAALGRLRHDLGDEVTFRDILASFADEAPGLMAGAVAAARAGDAKGLDRAAHSLKSMAATVGALALSEACRVLEARGRQGAMEGIAALAAEAEAELGRVLVEVRAAVRGAAGQEP